MSSQNKLLRLLKLIALLKQEPPKSVHYIARFLETSTRTAYRYIELLKEVGFNIEEDHFNKYSIQDHELLSPSHFNQEEIGFIRELLQSTELSSQLKQSILHKLSFNSDLELTNQDIQDARSVKIIQSIHQAISNNLQIILKHYQSINSQQISDRIVEPIKFTSQYRSLCAFEIESQQNKFFNIERIGDVEGYNQPQEFEHLHQFSKPDVFGFSKHKKVYVIDLQLDLKAKLLLTEEYPFTRPYVQQVDEHTFRFTAQIHNTKPIKRFYEGLKENIKVLDQTNFKL